MFLRLYCALNIICWWFLKFYLLVMFIFLLLFLIIDEVGSKSVDFFYLFFFFLLPFFSRVLYLCWHYVKIQFSCLFFGVTSISLFSFSSWFNFCKLNRLILSNLYKNFSGWPLRETLYLNIPFFFGVQPDLSFL